MGDCIKSETDGRGESDRPRDRVHGKSVLHTGMDKLLDSRPRPAFHVNTRAVPHGHGQRVIMAVHTRAAVRKSPHEVFRFLCIHITYVEIPLSVW
jgi:hypothetical protein